MYYTDFLHQTKGTYFFQVMGKNPLSIYLLSELLAICMYITPMGDTNVFGWIFNTFFSHIINPYFGSLLMAISFMLVCWSVGYIMDKKKIYIRI